jgi:hypothetical protein
MKLIALSILVVGFTAIAAAVFMNRYEYVAFHPTNSTIEVIQRFDRLTGKQCVETAHYELLSGHDPEGGIPYFSMAQSTFSRKCP